MKDINEIRVWDPLVRFFHWSLVVAFFIAYITEEEIMPVHIWAGYLVLALVMIRIFWGLVGSRYARFSDFIYSPKTVIQFIKDTLSLQAKRYIGHNPAGGAMVILLLISLLMTTVSGIFLLGIVDQSGPAATLFSSNPLFLGDLLEEVHEFFANLTVLLVVIHLAGVLAESFIHRENLVSAMLTGMKNRK